MTDSAPGYHLAVDEGDAYDFLSTLLIVKAAGTTTNNALAVVEQRLPAGFSPPPHIHHNEDEALYLLAGRIVAQLGEQQIAAERARSYGCHAACSTASLSLVTSRARC